MGIFSHMGKTEMMTTRRDISDKLIHFTSDENEEKAYQYLCKIVKERCILGTSEKIKGNYTCVCFSPSNSIK